MIFVPCFNNNTTVIFVPSFNNTATMIFVPNFKYNTSIIFVPKKVVMQLYASHYNDQQY